MPAEDVIERKLVEYGAIEFDGYIVWKYDDDFDWVDYYLDCAITLEGKSSRKVYPNVIDIVTTFDIETTYIKSLNESIMYTWQLALGTRIVIIGRHWEEFKCLLNHVAYYALDRKARIIMYVHNLPFEFQFIRSLIVFSEVLLLKPRKPLIAIYKDIIEFRCSYKLSNMSLGEFTQKMNVPHVKIDEDKFNYGKKRLPNTKLSDTEIMYICRDVIGLSEAIYALMKRDGDNLLTIPYTSTGYVRRDCRAAMHKVSRNWVERQLPDKYIYALCREAFRGGNTHANRYYVGHVLDNVYSADRSSSYPDVQCNDMFPVSRFNIVTDMTTGAIDRLMNHERALLMRVGFIKIELSDKYWGCPYIPIDKCRRLWGEVNDNGRVLSADYLEITITDVDFRIISSEYKWNKIVVKDMVEARYGPLPQSLKDVIINYYKQKTALKGVKGQEIFYIKNKNLLNSIFGMSAQDPVKDNYEMTPELEYICKKVDVEEELLKTRGAQFMPYQWGVWTTANARYRLEEGIRLAGDDFVYGDTDCTKTLREVDFSKYNKARIEASLKSGAYAKDAQGVTHYMGVFETEKKADKFVSWGAKRYVAVEDGKNYVTVSGVVKNTSAEELERKGGIYAFKPGFVFRESGGLEAVYADHQPREIEIDGQKVLLTSNVSLLPSTYTLGITCEYEKILLECGLLY